MIGAFRGMPTRLAIALLLATACSQDPQFIEKDMTPGSLGTEDASVGYCSPPGASGGVPGTVSECLVGKVQLAIEPSSIEIKVGESRSLKAFLVFVDGRKEDITARASWNSGQSENIKMVANGVFVGVAPGEAKVHASFLQSTASSTIEVKDVNVVKDPKVYVKVHGQEERVTLASGIETKVEWESKDVSSCRLYVNGKEFDRQDRGATSLKVSVDSKIEVTCQTEDGGSMSDAVEVKVTMPKVILAADGTIGSLTVNGARSVELKWSSTDAQYCDIFGDGKKIASAVAGATSAVVQKSQKFEAVCKDMAGNTVNSSVDVTLQYQSRITFSPGYFDQIAGSKTQRPVSIVFALDVTGSMASQIETVKTGVQDFVTQLSSRGFLPKIGVIPFRDRVPEGGVLGDVPEGRLELTDNVEDVKRFVGTLKATGGGDANEASLGAVRSAMNALRFGDQRPDAVKIVMLVTDQPGHGGASTTDCVLDPLVNQFAGLTADEQRNFKLFYSTPTTGSPCSGFASGSIQMATLLSKVLTAEAVVEKRGGLIAWPFANKNLVDDVVVLLEKVNPPIDLACLNTKATVSIDGVVQFVEELRDYAGEMRLLETGAQQSFAKTLTAAQFNSLSAGDGAMVVQRCCFSKAAAKAGKFDACLKTPADQSVPFAL